jgi:serine/threonine protein kinase
LARHEHTHEPRIYKFVQRGDDLTRLKREVRLFRILCENLDDHSAFVPIIDWNLKSLPYFLEYEYGGANLQEWADAGHLLRAAEPHGLSGTPPYIAPEILRGQAPTAQCDVYALGIILYQLLCGDLRKSLSPG